MNLDQRLAEIERDMLRRVDEVRVMRYFKISTMVWITLIIVLELVHYQLKNVPDTAIRIGQIVAVVIILYGFLNTLLMSRSMTTNLAMTERGITKIISVVKEQDESIKTQLKIMQDQQEKIHALENKLMSNEQE